MNDTRQECKKQSSPNFPKVRNGAEKIVAIAVWWRPASPSRRWCPPVPGALGAGDPPTQCQCLRALLATRSLWGGLARNDNLLPQGRLPIRNPCTAAVRQPNAKRFSKKGLPFLERRIAASMKRVPGQLLAALVLFLVLGSTRACPSSRTYLFSPESIAASTLASSPRTMPSLLIASLFRASRLGLQ
jgi:hypothetical protein